MVCMLCLQSNSIGYVSSGAVFIATCPLITMCLVVTLVASITAYVRRLHRALAALVRVSAIRLRVAACIVAVRLRCVDFPSPPSSCVATSLTDVAIATVYPLCRDNAVYCLLSFALSVGGYSCRTGIMGVDCGRGRDDFYVVLFRMVVNKVSFVIDGVAVMRCQWLFCVCVVGGWNCAIQSSGCARVYG